MHYVMYFRFVDDDVFSHNGAHFACVVVTGYLTSLYSFERILVLCLCFRYVPGVLSAILYCFVNYILRES